MANLETLELTINGSATSASEGIDKLIASLSSLSTAIIKPYSDLVDFNKVLKETASIAGKGLSFSGFNKTLGAIKKSASKVSASARKDLQQIIPEFRSEYKAGKQISPWRYGPQPPVNMTNNLGFQKGYETEEERKAKNPQWYPSKDDIKNGILARNEALRVKEVKEATKAINAEVKPLAQNSVVIKDLADNMYHYSKATETASEKTSALSKVTDFFKKGIGSVKSGVGKLTSGFTGMFGRIKRIATTMLIRKAIRSLIKAIGEGITNLYHWSKLNKGEFAQSLDSLKSKTTQLKNSIGAAIAPVIQAAIPVVRTLANALIDALNWANQLIALLSGQSTWTKAKEGAEEFIEDTDKATGSAKEWIAAWDELNVMSSDSGSGGGKTQTDYSNMFEEMSEFEEHIKGLADFFKENAKEIRDVAIEAGAAFLGWKVSEAFGGVLGTVAAIVASGLVMDITWKMTAMFDKEYLDTGEDGWLVADAITNAIGSTLAGTVIGSVLGTGAGIVTTGLTLLVSGGISYGIAMANADNDNAEALETIGLVKGLIGDLFIGAGFAVATGSLTAGAVASAIAAPLFFVVAAVVTEIVSAKNAQEIANEAFLNAGEGGLAVDQIFDSLQKKFDEYAAPYKVSIKLFSNKQQALADIEKVKTQLSSLNSVILSDQTLTLEQAEEFKQAWETVFSSFELANRDDWDTIFEGFNAAITIQDESLKEMAKNARIRALEINNGLTELEAQLVDRMNELVDKIIQGTATNEELEEYKQKMEAFGVIADETVSSFKKLVQGATTIDFGDAESGIAAAVEFIHNVTESYHETVASIDEGLEAQLAAIESQKSRIKDYLKAGLITQEQANQWIGELDSWAEIFTEAAENKKDSLAKDIQDAFGLVLNTAKEGLKQYLDDNGSIDFEGAATYVDSVIRPIIQAISDSDADVTEAIASVFTFGEDLKDYIDFEDLNELMNLIMGEIGQAAIEAGKTIDLGNRMIQSVFNLVNWDINDANKNEIALRLAEAFNFDAAVASLKEYFELDITSMIHIYGWKDLETAQQEALINALIKSYGSSETIVAIKKAVPDISIDEILNIVHYEEFGDEQSKEFVNVIKEIFGDDAAKQAAEAVGIEIGDAVGKGLGNNTEVKKQAKKVNDDITKEIDDKTHTTSAALTYNETEAKTVSDKLGKIVTSKTPKMKSALTYDSKTETATANKLSGVVTTKAPKMKAALSYDAKENAGISDKLSGLITNKKPVMKSSLSYTEKTETATRDKLAALVTGKKPVMQSSLSYTAKTETATRDKLAALVTNKKPLMTAALTYVGKTATEKRDALAKIITDKKPLMTASLTYVGKTAESKRDALAKIITDKKPNMTAGLTYVVKTAESKRDALAKIVTDKKPSMTASLTYAEKAANDKRDALAKVITDKKPSMTASLTFTQKTAESKRDELAKIITDKKPTMTAALTFVQKTAESKRDELAKIITDKNPKMTGSITYDEKTAKQNADALAKVVSDQKPVITATTFVNQGTKSETGSLTWLVDFMGSYAPQITAKSFVDQGKATDAGSLTWFLVEAIGKAAPTLVTWAFINQGTKNESGSVTWFLDLLSTLNPEIKAKAAFDKTQTKAALAAAVVGITVALAGIALGALTFKAEGGFVNSGDLFVANENGVPEMVGSFGHQTAVANNDQIVAGIAGGVAAANAEQNALLREQNGLLRGILQKSGNVTIGASAALGRVVNQSMNMYSGLVGG